MERRHRFRLALYGLLTLAVMALIYFFSAQNAEESRALSDGFLSTLIGALLDRLLPALTDRGMELDIRKYAHMFEYFCLGLTAFLFFAELWRRRLRLRPAAAALLLSFLYACSDEWHQRFVPGRAGRLSDVLIDAIGFGTGVLLTVAVQFLIDRRKKIS